MVEIKDPCGKWPEPEKVGVVLKVYQHITHDYREARQEMISVLHLSGQRENWFAGGWRVVSESR